MNRYRCHITETLYYCVDVLAKDEDEACEIAIATDMKGEPDGSCDADAELVSAETKDFAPINECSDCKGQIKDADTEFRCRSCRVKQTP